MDINNLTYGELKQIAAMFAPVIALQPAAHPAIPVVIWTDKRGVIFGYCADTAARPITLAKARMCLYWSAAVGGVFGLCDIGPDAESKISAALPSAVFEGVTGVATVTDAAEAAWMNAKTQGRK
jgi:hypothetical protein